MLIRRNTVLGPRTRLLRERVRVATVELGEPLAIPCILSVTKPNSQKLNTSIRTYKRPRLAGRSPSLTLLNNDHLFFNIFPLIPFFTSLRLWAVRGRRLLPFSRLTQLRAICYVRMGRDKERLRCERMSAIRSGFEGFQLQELAPPAHKSPTQKG